MYGYMIIGPYARELGQIGYLALLLAALCYLYKFRIIPSWSLLGLSLLSFVYATLSYFRFFDTSWTTYFDRDVIVRQMICVPAFAVLYTAYADIVSRYRFIFEKSYLLALFVIAPLISIFVAQIRAGELVGLPNLIGPSIALILGLGIASYSISNRILSLLLILLFSASIIAVSNNSQITLAGLLILLVFLFPGPKFGIYSGIIALSFSSILILYAGDLARLLDDPNSAIRLYIWDDALILIRDSRGLGIGYGTELIRNYYEEHVSLSPFPEEELLLISTHNTFVFLLARMGIVAFLLFSFFTLSIGLGIRAVKGRNGRVALLAWMLAILSLSVNVAIESVIFLTGTAFALAVAKGFSFIKPRGTAIVNRKESVELRSHNLSRSIQLES